MARRTGEGPGRVLVTGGGTGGHVMPGIAIARELQRREPERKVLFVGTRYGIERRLVPRSGFDLKLLPVRGLRGKNILDTTVSLFLLPFAAIKALWILLRFRPDVVVGVGGYASFPVCLMSRLLRKPLIIQEQNIDPGLANRFLGRLAAVVAVSFEASLDRFPPGRATVTGNPVLEAFGRIENSGTTGAPVLLVFGGSRGARAINMAVVEALPRLFDSGIEMEIIHQTGTEDEGAVKEAYRRLGRKARISAFIDDMPGVVAESRLALCRSGASTVAELTAAGRPALLVPFPQAAGGHQLSNARFLEREGAAMVIEQKDLEPGLLAGTILELLGDEEKLTAMSKAARRLGRPDAAERIVDLVESAMDDRAATSGPESGDRTRRAGE